jgi:organic hydroperoxide reductase OsmC/OhrA
MSAAESAHHDITGSTVAVEADLNEDNAGRKEANRLIQRAHETCPYSKAVRGNVDVVITLD